MSIERNLPRIALRGKKQINYSDIYNEIVEADKVISEAISLLADIESRELVEGTIQDIMNGRCIAARETTESKMPELIKRLKERQNDQFFEMIIPACSVLSDIWEIPIFFKEITTDGEISTRVDDDGSIQYLLSKGDRASLGGEYESQKKYEIRKVVALSGALYTFLNVELVKDVGMIPYYFHKLYGCDVKMVTYKEQETYPYLELLPGMQMELIEYDPPKSMVRYIHDNAEDIDLLIIHGAFEYNHDVICEYKRQNPGGKIFMHLDQNSEWMDRIIWDAPDYMEMMDLVDVMGSSCKSMQIHLNEKWPWHVECIRQGFYNVFGYDDDINELLKNKEKTILCAARHGTWQKATEVLLEAFAIIKDDISDWKLELVGSIEEEFESYIEEYFDKNPELRSRVIFYGNVFDRKQLHDHYLRAGIFTLTSRIEGGTPNVISEALYSGCAIALTMFDAYLDAVGPLDEDDRICGKAVPIDDIEGYACMLKELCMDEGLNEYQKNARWRAEKYFDAVEIERYLYGKLCG